MLHSFTQVLDLLPGAEELAREINESGNTIRKWRLRDSIPSAQWPAIVRAAEARGHTQVTLQALADLRIARVGEARRRAAERKQDAA